MQVQTPRRIVRPTHASHEPRHSSTSDAGEGPGSGGNSDVYARSTMEDALTSPKKLQRGHFGETSSDTSRSSSPVRESGTGPLSSSSRALIKQHLSETSPVSLPRGHPTVAFIEGQVSSILTEVANESAIASFDMLSNVVERASRPNLGGCSRCNQPRGPATEGSLLLTTDCEPDCSLREFSASRTGFASDLSQSNGAAGSSTMTPGSPRPSLTSVTHIPSPPAFGCSQEDSRGSTPLTARDSPGGQPLAALRQEAIKDKQVTQTSRRSATKSKIPRSKPIRGGRMMREEYFEGMSWTRVFVSGPLDLEHTPYTFYCLICKDNVFIYTKGPREIIRHYSSERRLRKDHRWRYEYLSVKDSVTGNVKHRVGGKNGKLLTAYQLELELPEFIDAPFVDLGGRMPFYEDHMAGQQHCVTTPDNKVRAQICVLVYFLPVFGNISVQRRLWGPLGAAMGQEVSFLGFNGE